LQTHPTQASDESGGPGLTATTFSAFEGNSLAHKAKKNLLTVIFMKKIRKIALIREE